MQGMNPDDRNEKFERWHIKVEFLCCALYGCHLEKVFFIICDPPVVI